METHLSPRQARERNAELLDTFARLVRCAREEGVTGVIIAGDLFDGARTRSSTLRLVTDLIAQAPEVDFLYLPGNHDGAGRLPTPLPANLKLFGSRWTQFSYGDVTVTGIAPEPREAAGFYEELTLDRKKRNIVVLHGQEATRPGEGLVCLPLLKNRGIDYLALGHLHSYRQEPLDATGVYCYSGCLEGRGFDECGQKGFVLLETAPDRLKTRFVPFARRRLWEVPVDITGLDTLSLLRDGLTRAARDIPREDLVTFRLTGAYTPDTQKDLAHLRAFVKDSFYYARIKDDSVLEPSGSSYAHDISLKGEFLRAVMASSLTPEEKQRVIGAGLRALCGEEVEL